MALLLRDEVLKQPWVQDQCQYFQVIVLVSKGKYNITFYRKDGHFSWPDDCDRAVWLQNLKVIRPLVDECRLMCQ